MNDLRDLRKQGQQQGGPFKASPMTQMPSISLRSSVKKMCERHVAAEYQMSTLYALKVLPGKLI